jgi:protease-4
MRDYAASGGYYIGVNADHIVAHPATITGSIGVILQYVNVEGLAKKVGVAPVTIKSGPLKDMASPFRDLTAEEREILQGLIDESYGEFVDVVDAGRKDLDEEEVRELADGRIYTGIQAEKAGLVDELGGENEVYSSTAKLIEEEADDDEDVKPKDLKVVRYAPSFGFWEQLGSATGPTLSLNMVMDELQAQLLGRGAGTPTASATPNRRVQTGPAHAGLPQLEYRAVL